MDQVTVAAIQAAVELVELTESSDGGTTRKKQPKVLIEEFARHYAAIIKAINENPIRETAPDTD